MTTLFEQIDATKDRLVREQHRLVLGTERTRRALVRAVRDEAASWQRFASEKHAAAADALVELRSRTGLERAMLRATERTLEGAHARVRARLARLDRELAADATPASPAPAEAKPRARARRTKRAA